MENDLGLPEDQQEFTDFDVTRVAIRLAEAARGQGSRTRYSRSVLLAFDERCQLTNRSL